MRHAKPFTVRFWHYANTGGPVRMALRDGQTLSHTVGGPTEEGYSYCTETLSRDGDTVYLEAEHTARDCDGRLDQSFRHSCPLTELASGNESLDFPDLYFPRWDRETASQRDYEAERAGY